MSRKTIATATLPCTSVSNFYPQDRTLNSLTCPEHTNPWAWNAPGRRYGDAPWERADGAPNLAEQASLRARGLDLDPQGRPLHPWVLLRNLLPQLPHDLFSHWGAQDTADAMVIGRDQQGQPHLLLIEREHGQGWAMPGGFVDDADGRPANDPSTLITAATRELQEETGLLAADLTLTAPPRLAYRGPVVDPLSCRHVWMETGVVVVSLAAGEALPTLRPGDDAVDAAWVPFDHLQAAMNRGEIFTSHQALLELLISRHPNLSRHYHGRAAMPPLAADYIEAAAITAARQYWSAHQLPAL